MLNLKNQNIKLLVFIPDSRLVLNGSASLKSNFFSMENQVVGIRMCQVTL